MDHFGGIEDLGRRESNNPPRERQRHTTGMCDERKIVSEDEWDGHRAGTKKSGSIHWESSRHIRQTRMSELPYRPTFLGVAPTLRFRSTLGLAAASRDRAADLDRNLLANHLRYTTC